MLRKRGIALLVAAYAAPWPVAMGWALALNGLVLALIPIRRGEKWAIWLSALTLFVLLATRTFTDPRCSVVLDPHQHAPTPSWFLWFPAWSASGWPSLAVPRPSRKPRERSD